MPVYFDNEDPVTDPERGILVITTVKTRKHSVKAGILGR